MDRKKKKGSRTQVVKDLTADVPNAVQKGAAQLRCKTLTADGAALGECVLKRDVFKATGTRSVEALSWIVSQAANARVWPAMKREEAVAGSLAVLEEIRPQNAIEAMLAVQMIAANDLAMMFMYRASLKEQSPEITDANVARATRLMRVFTEQLEAMQKLRGKSGQQKVTVEHVHVHQGGQAIVGAVSAKRPGEGGRGDGNEK